MKLAVAVVLVSFLIAPKVMNAIAMPNPNDNTLDPSDPISDNICKCSGKTVKELSGNILGECQHKLLTTTSFFAILTRHPSQKNVVRTPLEDFKMHVSTTVFAAVQIHQNLALVNLTNNSIPMIMCTYL